MKRFCIHLTIGIFFVIAAFGSAHASDKVYTLKIADSFPINHPLAKVVNHFIDAAKKESNGKLDFQYFPAQQLGKLHDMLKICQQGMAEITYVGPTFFPGQLGLNTVAALPFYDSAKQGSAIFMELYKQSPEIQKEWANNRVRPVLFAGTSQYQVGIGSKPLTRMEDLNGLKLKTPGGIFDNIAQRYGIVPVAMSFNDAYESIQRGIIDGAVHTLPSVKGYRLYEVEKQQTLGLRLGGYVAAYVINDKKFNKLPEDLQQALLKAGENATAFFADLWDNIDTSLVKTFEEQGMTFYQIPADKKQEWFAPLKGIEEEWIEQYEAKDLPARKVFEQFHSIAEKVVNQ